MKHFFLCLFGLMSCILVRAASDTITIVQIPAILVGDSGQQCLWDYSMMKDSLNHEVYILRDSLRPQDMVVQKLNAKYNYHWNNDTLCGVGFENATTQMVFNEPVVYFKAPFHLGDSVAGLFSGQGEYGRLLPISMAGTYISRVDGVGALRLPHQNYDSVFRVVTECDIVKHIYDTTFFHVKEYRWYNYNGSYPLLEATEVTTLLPNDTTLNRFAFYAIIEEEELPERIDNPDESPVMEQTQDSCLAFTEGQFLPNPVVNDLLVSYHLTRTATIWFSLHSSQGIVMFRSSPVVQEEGDWQLTIPMSGLPVDDYVLYIHVDDIVLAETIIKM